VTHLRYNVEVSDFACIVSTFIYRIIYRAVVDAHAGVSDSGSRGAKEGGGRGIEAVAKPPLKASQIRPALPTSDHKPQDTGLDTEVMKAPTPTCPSAGRRDCPPKAPASKEATPLPAAERATSHGTSPSFGGKATPHAHDPVRKQVVGLSSAAQSLLPQPRDPSGQKHNPAIKGQNGAQGGAFANGQLRGSGVASEVDAQSTP